MFPTQYVGSVFDDPSIFEQDKILDELLADCVALEGNEPTDKGVKKRPRKTSSSSEFQENTIECSNSSKKTMHRDTERQRRQEMAGLYASLRSLLPLEYVKGRRAISDHMHQAVYYIENMQKKIEEMKMRRDKLKKLSGVCAAVDAQNPNSNNSCSSYRVKVNLFRNGMEILVSSCLNEGDFLLSKVLSDLLGRGLNVITCVSTRHDQFSIHKLQIELNDTTSIDLSELQERLDDLIKLA